MSLLNHEPIEKSLALWEACCHLGSQGPIVELIVASRHSDWPGPNKKVGLWVSETVLWAGLVKIGGCGLVWVIRIVVPVFTFVG